MEENFNLVLRTYDKDCDRTYVNVWYNSSRSRVKEILFNTLSQPEIYQEVEYSLVVASSAIHCSLGNLAVGRDSSTYDEDRADVETEILETLRDEINVEVEEIKKKDLLQQLEARKQQDAATKEQEEAKEKELYYSLKQKYEHS